jgi:hypothetical protein
MAFNCLPLLEITVSVYTYSGVCAGWGWGESSFVRNIRVDNNSITKPMQVCRSLLALLLASLVILLVAFAPLTLLF